MLLQVVDGPMAGQTYEINDLGCVIGRDEACDVVIESEQASREHGRIFRQGDDYFLTDLDSTNGVRLNGIRVEGSQPVKAGDQIEIGDCHLVVLDMNGGKAGTLVAMPVPEERPEPRPEPALPDGFGKKKEQAAHKVNPLILVAVLLVVGALVWAFWPDGEEDAGGSYLPGPEVGDSQVSPSPTDHVGAVPAPSPVPPSTAASPADTPEPPPIEANDAGQDVPPKRPLPLTQADYLWLDTIPTGAAVRINSEAKGKTPLFLEHLPEGRFHAEFFLPGYEPHGRFVEVPNSGERQEISLRQEDGTCLVTSVPAGAGVLHGSQLVGYTPYFLRDRAPGEYELRLVMPRHEEATVTAIIDPKHPKRINAMLKPTSGGIRVVALPAGAKVYVNGVQRGIAGKAGGAGKSLPLELPGFKADMHQVYLEYEGERTKPIVVEVTAGQTVEAALNLWFPDIRVRTVDGKSFAAMLLEKNEAGDLTLANRRFDAVKIPAAKVEQTSLIAPSEAKKLLGKSRPPPKDPDPGH